MLKIGIDDAGRGPVIGPMIIAGCLIDDKDEKFLKELGVRDSKELTQKRREFLEEKIKEKVISFEISIISPSEIDESNARGLKLNELEAVHMAKVVNKLNVNSSSKIKLIVDCPSTTISKWKDFLKTKISDLSNLEVVCEHKADKNYPVVSAASILAKCEREREMEKLRKIYGEEIGTGYPADPLTCRFLEKNVKKLKDKGIFRKTWETWKNAENNANQEKLF
ncbi:MAG: ribonuclease HII [Candidatus Pacearchaeota archaeon]|jgi:ribonuclease HII